MSDFKLRGHVDGSGSVILQSANTNSALTQTLPSTDSVTLGYLNVPPVGTKTSVYTLAAADVGKYVQLGTNGNVTIIDGVFAEGDVVTVFNNTANAISMNCAITTAYISGTDSDKATVNIASRGLATILFISSNTCVITGSVS